MAKVHRSYRMEAETVERVAAWAEEHGKTITQAMEELLARAMDEDMAEREEDTAQAADEAQAEAWREQRAMLGEHIRDLRANVSTLTAQVAEKDRQIARLQDIAEHEQVLQAAHVGRAISGDVAHDVSQEEAQPRGIWAWLARKIEGR